MTEKLCSICNHPYDSHGSHSWCENKPCDCERIPIVDELYKQVDELREELYPLQVKLDTTISERDTLRKQLNVAMEALKIYRDIVDYDNNKYYTIPKKYSAIYALAKIEKMK